MSRHRPRYLYPSIRDLLMLGTFALLGLIAATVAFVAYLAFAVRLFRALLEGI